jgi:hypothetical protein
VKLRRRVLFAWFRRGCEVGVLVGEAEDEG